MKVALVHDYLKEYGGAERVLEALHEIYPDATVFTSVYLPSYLGPHKERFKNWNIKTTWLQSVPFKAKLISPLRLLAPIAFKSLDFSEYDVIIVSATGAYFPNVIRSKGQSTKGIENTTPIALRSKLVHICYCHTPPRYLYGYATAREWKKNKAVAAIASLANHILRMVDFNASKNVDEYIANSEEVKRRIEKFYRREATVIYPPVDIGSSAWVVGGRKKGTTSHEPRATTYFVAGGRLARPKHIDLIIKACLKLEVPLKVFGKGFAGYGEELRSLANGEWQMAHGAKKPLIEFMGEVSDEEKMELLAGAKAYLFASEDEDFGILPVEAMSVGTPVIAYRSGGVKETVVHEKTGLFFDELSVDSLMKAIKQFEKSKIDAKDCIKQAEKFSKERFKKEIENFVNAKVKR